MTAISQEPRPATHGATPVLQAVNIVKTYGHVVALDGVDLELYPGEVLAVIGDNGAGKSTLIKCLSGAEAPSTGQIMLDGKPVTFKTPLDARNHGIETVYQTLAVSPSLDIAGNLFLGREERRAGPLGSIFRMLDGNGMRKHAKEQMSSLGIGTLQNMGQAVESLSGGQRQAVAVARAAAFSSKVIILDEPTAALGVKESGQVLKLIQSIRERGMPVILISHNMPQVFEVADRIHIQRLGKRAAVVSPKTISMSDAVAVMTGALKVAPEQQVDETGRESVSGQVGLGDDTQRLRGDGQRRVHRRRRREEAAVDDPQVLDVVSPAPRVQHAGCRVDPRDDGAALVAVHADVEHWVNDGVVARGPQQRAWPAGAAAGGCGCPRASRAVVIRPPASTRHPVAGAGRSSDITSHSTLRRATGVEHRGAAPWWPSSSSSRSSTRPMSCRVPSG